LLDPSIYESMWFSFFIKFQTINFL
jgi:hypothetical protein